METPQTTSLGKNRRPSLGAVGIVVTTAALMLAAFCFTPIGRSVLSQTNNAGDDLLARIGDQLDPSPQIVLLELNDEAISSSDPALAPFTESPPFSRAVLARAINRLREAGATKVGIDLLVSRPSERFPEGDIELAAAAADHPQTSFFATEITSDPEAPLLGGHAVLAVPEGSIVPRSENANQLGVVTLPADRADGIVRHISYRFPVNDAHSRTTPSPDVPLWPSMALRLAGAELGDSDASQARRIRWTKSSQPNEYSPFSSALLSDLFDTNQWQNTFDNGKFFDSKLVLISAANNDRLSDTPIGTTSPTQIQLCALNAALAGDHGFITELPSPWDRTPFAGGIVLALLLFFLIRRPVIRIAATALTVLLVLGAIWVAFNHFSVIIPWSGLMISLLAVSAAGIFTDLAEHRAAKEELVQSLTRQTSLKVTQKISRNPSSYLDSLSGARRPMTLLMVNLKDFADVVEPRKPSHGVHQLNEYLESINHCIFENDGTTSTSPGDSMLASWGSLRKEDPAISAPRALEAARQMRRELDKLNSQWQRQKQPPLKQGIGLHIGESIVGEIGPNNQRQLNIVGRTANTVRQIEGLTHKFGSEIIISEAMRELLPEDVQALMRPLPYIQMRGNPKALVLFDVLRSERVPHWESYKADYLSGLHAFIEGDFESAVRRFDRCRSASPADGLVATMLEGAQGFVARAPRKWKGVISLDNR